MNLTAQDHRHLWHPFTAMHRWLDTAPLIIAAAEGCELIDIDGRRYLDGVSSLWVNVHGHRHPAIDAAIRAQLDRVAHSTLLGLGNVPSIELAARLVAVAPPGLERLFYSDSGSTAVEVALKVAFQYQRLKGRPERSRFLSLTDAYHGDTIGSVSLGGMELFHRLFQPLLFDALHVAPTVEALERAFAEHGRTLAAFVVEPLVQGAAGMRLQPPGFLRAARALCDQYEVPLICDEVATGFGRTGTLFACEQEGVSPDVLCLAKGITGGYLPLAATLFREEIFRAFVGTKEAPTTFFHGHTYTGNPLACAAAIASLDLFEKEQTLARLAPKIDQLQQLLAARIAPLAAVRHIRQRGFMVGIELGPYEPERLIGAQVCQAVRGRGVIVRPLGDVIVLMPPLAISAAQLETLVDATREAIRETLPAA